MGGRYKRSEAKRHSTKAKFLSEMNQAVSELNDVLAGRRQAQDAYDLLDILDCSTRRNEPVRPFRLQLPKRARFQIARHKSTKKV